MNILAPIQATDEISTLIKAGATEFYFGYIPEYWINRYNRKFSVGNGEVVYERILLSLNKREQLDANISSYDLVKEICDTVHKYDREVFVTLNAFFYPDDAYDLLDRYLNEVEHACVDGVIVSDPGLIHYISKEFPNLKIILSCITNVRNSESCNLFKDLGVSRITLPRHINFNDVCEITTQTEDLEYEIFIFGLGLKCIYDNSNCLTSHAGGAFCKDQWDYRYESTNNIELSFNEIERIAMNERRFVGWTKDPMNYRNNSKSIGSFECGLCRLPQLIKDANVSTLKLEGRGVDLQKKVMMLNYVTKTLEIIENGGDDKVVRDYIKAELPFKEQCDNQSRCYMPFNV